MSSLHYRLSVALGDSVYQANYLAQDYAYVVAISTILVAVIFIPRLQSPFLLYEGGVLQVLCLEAVLLAGLLAGLGDAYQTMLCAASTDRAILYLGFYGVYESIRVQYVGWL